MIPKNAEYQERTDSLLREMQSANEVLQMITETLFILNGKRETLEEKTIKRIFHELAKAICRHLVRLNEICLSRSFPPEVKLEAGAKLFQEIRLSVSELLKMARYDLNFLEQYFEYDYCARLHGECQFVERVEKLTADLSV